MVIVGFLVTLFLLLVTLGAFDFAAYIDGNRVVHSLVIVLAIIYTVLGVYLVIEIFAGDSGLSTMVLLFRQHERRFHHLPRGETA